MNTFILYIINPLIYIIPILIAVAFLTLLERKILGYMQLRKGPNVVGPFGILQPIADGVKLFTKEPIRPTSASPTLFIITPASALLIALMMWNPLPMPYPLTDMNFGLLLLLAFSSMMVYTILWSGWASNSKYALMGALRAIAQTISYEVTLGMILLSLIMMTGTFTLQTFIFSQEYTWFVFSTWPLTMMWFISTLAETNRAPFDLTEGESELVSGFNVEYAAGPFALFFLAEYMNILLMNTLTCILFLSPTLTSSTQLFTLNLLMKTTLLTLMFLWIRASYPRFRYDQLMHLLWKQFLPMTLAMFMWYISLPIVTASIPPIN